MTPQFPLPIRVAAASNVFWAGRPDEMPSSSEWFWSKSVPPSKLVAISTKKPFLLRRRHEYVYLYKLLSRNSNSVWRFLRDGKRYTNRTSNLKYGIRKYVSLGVVKRHAITIFSCMNRIILKSYINRHWVKLGLTSKTIWTQIKSTFIQGSFSRIWKTGI